MDARRLGEREWSVPLDDAQWRAFVKFKPRLTLEFLLASGPGCLESMLAFRDSLGRSPPMARVDRLGGALQVYMTGLNIPAAPTLHERAVAGADRFSAKYWFKTPERTAPPATLDDVPELRQETFELHATEEGRFLRLREFQDPRAVRRLADAVGFAVPPGLARLMRRKPVEVPWTTLRVPWPGLSRWLEGQRPRVERVVFRRRSIPRETVPGLVGEGAEVVLWRRGAEVVADRRARLGRVMELLGPCPASFTAEMQPGDARRGSLHVGQLKGTGREVSYGHRLLRGDWRGGRLTLWAGEEGADWGEIARGLEAEG